MAENTQIGLSAKFFKKELKLAPQQLTLEYLKQQNIKIQSPEKLEELERNIRKTKFPVLILGDNEEPGKPSSTLEKLQQDITKLGFLCGLGSHIYFIQNGKFEAEIEREMLDDPDYPKLIILVAGERFGTIGESKVIRLRDDLNSKTLFFFDHKGDYEWLIELATNKQFPVEFKYPIPYTGEKELNAKVLFGVLHCFYRYWYFKRSMKKASETNNKEKGGEINDE